MKKYNALVFIIYFVCFIAAACLIGIVAGRLVGVTGINNVFLILSLGSCWIFFVDIANLILFPIAKHTMKKNMEEENFGRTAELVSDGIYSLKTMLCIDEDSGRIAYVSPFNPYSFQTAHAGDLTKVRSAYSRGPFGGTRIVFFEFYYNGKRSRFPIFRSRHTWALSSSRVQNAIARGDEICRIINRFQPPLEPVVRSSSPRSKVPLAKSGITGLVLAFVSLDLNAALMLYYLMYSPAIAMQDEPFKTLSFLVFLPGAGLAIAGLILAIKALVSASKTPMRGKGFAIAALVLSSVVLVLLILVLIYLRFAVF